jgi:hypothetical protein
MDNPELIDNYGDKIWQIIFNMRHDGISNKTIHHIFDKRTKDLKTMADAEIDLSRSEKP